MMDEIPDMVPGDRWGFGGDLIWKAVLDVGSLTEVQGQILYYPRTRVVGFTIDRCINNIICQWSNYVPQYRILLMTSFYCIHVCDGLYILFNVKLNISSSSIVRIAKYSTHSDNNIILIGAHLVKIE